MVIDPSAILAILQDEPERGPFIDAIEAAHERLISAPSLVELSIVTEARCGAGGLQDLDLFLVAAGIETVPFDAAQALLARLAFQRFGKGRHPAGLNFGDCLSYALAICRNQPLLFKGNDLSLTDVARVIEAAEPS
ncbi:MAG: type II toxin-antitoxin system VapC family toxin [Synechococcus sp.]|nr:type II toxin-antitoxin system VapC family toxin [Synechococcus sp.]